MLSPSAIQRAEDLVGMAMPTVPLPWATAPDGAAATAASASAMIVVFSLSMLHSLRGAERFLLALRLAQLCGHTCGGADLFGKSRRRPETATAVADDSTASGHGIGQRERKSTLRNHRLRPPQMLFGAPAPPPCGSMAP